MQHDETWHYSFAGTFNDFSRRGDRHFSSIAHGRDTVTGNDNVLIRFSKCARAVYHGYIFNGNNRLIDFDEFFYFLSLPSNEQEKSFQPHLHIRSPHRHRTVFYRHVPPGFSGHCKRIEYRCCTSDAIAVEFFYRHLYRAVSVWPHAGKIWKEETV